MGSLSDKIEYLVVNNWQRRRNLKVIHEKNVCLAIFVDITLPWGIYQKYTTPIEWSIQEKYNNIDYKSIH